MQLNLSQKYRFAPAIVDTTLSDGEQARSHPITGSFTITIVFILTRASRVITW